MALRSDTPYSIQGTVYDTKLRLHEAEPIIGVSLMSHVDQALKAPVLSAFASRKPKSATEFGNISSPCTAIIRYSHSYCRSLEAIGSQEISRRAACSGLGRLGGIQGRPCLSLKRRAVLFRLRSYDFLDTRCNDIGPFADKSKHCQES